MDYIKAGLKYYEIGHYSKIVMEHVFIGIDDLTFHKLCYLMSKVCLSWISCDHITPTCS